MEPIKNSTMKEEFRRKNEEEAKQQEYKLRRDLETYEKNQAKRDEKSGVLGCGTCILLAVISILLKSFGFFVVGLIIIIVYATVIGPLMSKSSIEQKKRVMEAQIAHLYREAEQKTKTQIGDYERDVKAYHDRLMTNVKNLGPMADHTIMMLERMISHADNRSHKAFIEADLNYVVNRSGIVYIYDKSRYQNPQDDFDFDVNRYRPLSTAAECEGLAQVIAKMVIAKMKKKCPPNSMRITVTHNDANVVLHYAGNNPNYIPPKDIV